LIDDGLVAEREEISTCVIQPSSLTAVTLLAFDSCVPVMGIEPWRARTNESWQFLVRAEQEIEMGRTWGVHRALAT